MLLDRIKVKINHVVRAPPMATRNIPGAGGELCRGWLWLAMAIDDVRRRHVLDREKCFNAEMKSQR